MKSIDKRIYDEFYVAFLDLKGDILYPKDKEKVNIITSMLKRATSGNLIYLEDRNLYYKARIKREEFNGQKFQVVELSNVTEFFKQVCNASEDEITHLNNRKIARNLFTQYIEQAYQRGDDFGVILADLDDFKQVNDTYGHVNGDAVLSDVSRILYCSTRQDTTREQDVVARIGGDEFFILIKNAPEHIALERAEYIRKSVETHQTPLFNENNIVEYINAGTLSMGLYHIKNSELKELYDRGYTTEEIRTLLLDRSDTTLYESKNNGKNRVTVFEKGKILKLNIENE